MWRGRGSVGNGGNSLGMEGGEEMELDEGMLGEFLGLQGVNMEGGKRDGRSREGGSGGEKKEEEEEGENNYG